MKRGITFSNHSQRRESATFAILRRGLSCFPYMELSLTKVHGEIAAMIKGYPYNPCAGLEILRIRCGLYSSFNRSVNRNLLEYSSESRRLYHMSFIHSSQRRRWERI